MKAKLQIIALVFLVAFLSAGGALIIQSPARAQVEEQQPKEEAKEEPQAIAAQAVIVITCKPEQLVEEIHRLNKLGQAVTKEDVQVVGDKVMIFIMVGTESQEER